MDDLATLQAFGLELPCPAYIFGAIVFGLIGLVAFRHGRKTGRRWTLRLGVAPMVYPYAISRILLLYAGGGVLCTGVLVDRD